MQKNDKIKNEFLRKTSFKNVSGNWQFNGDITPERTFEILKELLNEEVIDNALASVIWPCLNCGQDTSATEFLCCCSRECLKQWLDKPDENIKPLAQGS